MARKRWTARPTSYKGVRMRSRNEAGFAQWLDGRHWNWEYEPLCFADETGQYLPDFRICFDEDPASGIWVELKPTAAMALGDRDRMAPIRSTYPDASLAVVTKAGDTYSLVGQLLWGGQPWGEGGCWELPASCFGPCVCGAKWIDPEYGRCEDCWQHRCMVCGSRLEDGTPRPSSCCVPREWVG